MKILYAAGNRNGADLSLYRFLQHNSYEIKIAAYSHANNLLTHFDWTLDSLNHKYSETSTKNHEIFGHKKVPPVNSVELEKLIVDIDNFGPDLIINDFEPITAHMAESFGIPLWYCSPIHLVDGMHWLPGQKKYHSLMETVRRYLPRLPEAERVLVYSPFGDLKNPPKLKQGYEWVSPYHISANDNEKTEKIAVIKDASRISELSKILNCIPPFDLKLFSLYSYKLSHVECGNFCDEEVYGEFVGSSKWLFTTGETSFLSDALYNGVNRVCVAPSLLDQETLLNAMIIDWYGLGDDVAQVERLGKYSVEEIEKSINANKLRNIKLTKKNKYLHEIIEESF
jgi:uncharacterized protein (TIGR00661 family)